MKTIRFTFYYITLRLKVALGFYQTPHPLGIKWRWRHWQRPHSLLMQLW